VDRVAVALGSNLGDRTAHLDYAVARLQTFLDDLKVSPYREYPPVGVFEAQPPYLNAAAVGIGTLSARALLDALLGVERARGRERPYARAPRTLDLDLILFGGVVVNEPGLVVPHPRFRERRFVLEPLAEIAADLADPVTGLTVGELARRIAAG
jgi:2-amino-4-hydroxy-6-hydroxymethyldihydropteridine diphosphokinase